MKAADSLPRSTRILLVLGFVSYAFSFAFPLLSTILSTRSGLQASTVGWIMSVAFLLSAAAQPSVGRWLDRGYDGLVLQLSAIGILLGIGGIWLSEQLGIFLTPALTIFIISFSSVATAAYRIVEGMATPESRGKASLFFAASTNLGFALSAALAFYFLQNHQSVLLILDAVSTLFYIYTLYYFRPQTATSSNTIDNDSPVTVSQPVPVQVPSKQKRKVALIGVLLISISNAACLSAIPLLYGRQGLLGIQMTPVMFGVGNVVVALLGIGLAKKINQLRTGQLLFWSSLLFALGHAMIPWVNSQAENILVTIFWSVGEVFTYPLLARVTFGCYLPTEAGRAAAVKNSLIRLSMAATPALAAILLAYPSWIFSVVFGLIPVVAGGCFYFVIKELPSIKSEFEMPTIQDWILKQFRRGVLIFLSLSVSLILLVGSFLMISDKINQLIDSSRSFIHSQISNLQIYDFTRLNSDLHVFAVNKPVQAIRMFDGSGTEIGQWTDTIQEGDLQSHTVFTLPLTRSGTDALALTWKLEHGYQLILRSQVSLKPGLPAATLEIQIATLSLLKSFLLSLCAVLIVMILTYFLGLRLARKSARAASEPMEELSQVLLNAQSYDDLENINIHTELVEASILIERFKSMSRRLSDAEEKRIEAEMLRATGILAAQVAHDIRSPLAALDVVLLSTDAMPPEKRLLARSAIMRIKDIANDLLFQRQSENQDEIIQAKKETGVYLISSLLEQIVSEKRLQYRDLLDVEIEDHLTIESYGLFAAVQPCEFHRMISNLLNNSVEAFPEGQGKVVLTLHGDHAHLVCAITDNGHGIPAHVLPSLGQLGSSFGKEHLQAGTGLGIFHARRTVEGWKGNFGIESEVGKGTTVRICLPRAATPLWFKDKLSIERGSHIVIVDDDSSIHRVWRERVDSLSAHREGLRFSNFSSPELFTKWLLHYAGKNPLFFLIDYEFLDSEESGLDLISKLNLASRAVLVTSRHEERQVRERAAVLGVAIIPKGMAGSVPIEFVEPLAVHDAILIDDDPLVREVWKVWADQNGKSVCCFTSIAEFINECHRHSKLTRIYVDSHLGDSVRGEEASKEIFARGFNELYITTGYERDHFGELPHIKAIVGKEPFSYDLH